MPDPSVWTALVGGAFGSSFTYGLSWFRERRRTLDAYRAPQRQAIGAIVAATHVYLLCQLELHTAMYEVISQDRAGGPVTSADEQWAATKALGAASIALESAFQTGALTIGDAQCWEAQVDAYAAFERLKRTVQAAKPVQNFEEVESYIAANNDHGEQLKRAVGDLVKASYGRVSPVGGWLNWCRRRKALKRSRERHLDLLGGATPPPDGTASA